MEMQRKVLMGDLSFQTREIYEDLMSSWQTILSTNSFIGGSTVASFENEFAQYLGEGKVIGVGNGTDALEIILQGLELPEGSTVLVQANSFVASAEAALNVGLKVDFFDVLPDFSIDLTDLESKLGPQVSAVIIVHLYGHPQPVESVLALLQPHGIPLVEDCAQAHGATVGGKKVGTFGVAAAFSFYPGKNLGALGDAGAITTSDEKLAEKFRRISNHGRLSKFDHEIRGRNSRLDPIQAAALSLKLERLEVWNSRRLRNANRYRDRLAGVTQIVTPPNIEGSVYHHFVIQHEKRDELREQLGAVGIQTGLHYPEALSETRYLTEQVKPCPNAEALASRILSIPVAEHLELDDVDYVCDQLIRICSQP